MTIADKLVAATAGSGAAGLKGDSTDVFSTYVYTGNGSTQTITNGIDLAGEGGMVWIKQRGQSNNHSLFDTDRGITLGLHSNSTGANQTSATSLTSFNSDGFSLGSGDAPGIEVNTSLVDHAAWTFRKAPKFFDTATISHTTGTPTNIDFAELGELGQVIVKSTSISGDWLVWHRSLTASNNLRLNTTAAQSTTNAWVSVSGTTVTLSGSAPTASYVVYAYAHDPAEGGIIQCGSFIGSAGVEISLGWEPQYIILKDISAANNWYILDSIRGMVVDGSDQYLEANTADQESPVGLGHPTATGFKTDGIGSGTWIYLAIRRPNRVPTSGAEVFAVDTLAAALPSYSSGFVVDLAVQRWVAGVDSNKLYARLMQGRYIATTLANAESGDAYGVFDYADGWNNTNSTSTTAYSWMFKRAPKFMDVVCDTGTGASHTINHNLTVVPELIIRKSRSNATQWEVWHSAISANEKLVLNTTAAKVTDSTAWNNTLPTNVSFSVGSSSNTNTNSATYVTCLFATLPKVSKVGSYIGNGSSQAIDCGFLTSARFILIKRTDSTGDWYIWDSVRGIVAANDPHLSLNTTAAQVTTDDSVDPDVTGFIVNQNTATNINVNTANYIFLAIA